MVRLAFGAWWREMVEYALLNMVWIGSLLTVVGGPPATAAMYQMAKNSASHDYVGFRPFFKAMATLFVPAWKWALIQVVVYGIIGFNLLNYAYSEGPYWAVMRLLWIIGLVVWSVFNLFYWPFYLRQDDQRIRNTYRNVFVLCIKRPDLVIWVAFLTVLVLVLSIATGVVFAFGLMALIALFGTFAVQSALSDFVS